MTEAVEVAIELALLQRAQAFATAQGLTISLPNVEFSPPSPPLANSKWLRATLLPADTVALGVSWSATNQHQGLLQLDVMFGTNGGEIKPSRIASQIVSYFARGTEMVSNGFKVVVVQTPKLGPLLSKDVWTTLPVRIPYMTFAAPA